MSACSTEAMQPVQIRDDFATLNLSLVRVNFELCVAGCNDCFNVCPAGAGAIGPAGRAQVYRRPENANQLPDPGHMKNTGVFVAVKGGK